MSTDDSVAAQSAAVTYEMDPAERVSEAVVAAVARASGRQPVYTGGDRASALDPLYDVVDPDALNALVDPDQPTAGVQTITFQYAGYEVTVRASGRVRVANLESDARPSAD